LRLSSFGGYGLALAALALGVFGAIECPPTVSIIPIKVIPAFGPKINPELEEVPTVGLLLT